MITYAFERGETVRIPLLITEGNKDLVSNIRANLKPAVSGKIVPPAATPVSATFTIYESELGWILELSASVTATLQPGVYITNAAMEVGGATIITDPSIVKINPSTTI